MDARKIFWSGAIFQLFQFLIIGIIVMVFAFKEIDWNFWVVAGIIWGLLNVTSLILLIIGAVKMESD